MSRCLLKNHRASDAVPYPTRRGTRRTFYACTSHSIVTIIARMRFLTFTSPKLRLDSRGIHRQVALDFLRLAKKRPILAQTSLEQFAGRFRSME